MVGHEVIDGVDAPRRSASDPESDPSSSVLGTCTGLRAGAFAVLFTSIHAGDTASMAAEYTPTTVTQPRRAMQVVDPFCYNAASKPSFSTQLHCVYANTIAAGACSRLGDAAGPLLALWRRDGQRTRLGPHEPAVALRGAGWNMVIQNQVLYKPI